MLAMSMICGSKRGSVDECHLVLTRLRRAKTGRVFKRITLQRQKMGFVGWGLLRRIGSGFWAGSICRAPVQAAKAEMLGLSTFLVGKP